MFRLIALVLTIFFASAVGGITVDPEAIEPAPDSYVQQVGDAAQVRIGLYYGSTAMSYANLQNAVGNGYQFGYFESGRQFVPLGYTDTVKITMLKNRNLYLNSANEYVDEKPDNLKDSVGCYHIRLGRYGTFEEAANAAASVKDAYPAFDNGVYYVQVGNYFSAGAASDANKSLGLGGTVLTGSERCVVVVASGTSDIIFWFDYGTVRSLGIMPLAAEGIKPVTWFKGYKFYGGFEYTRNSGPDMTVVNVLNIDDYVKGVLPYEMSPTWPLEALKAQAVCARTYVAYNRNKHRTYGFDLCTGTDCQVYMGINNADPNTDRAVDETSGQYIMYGGEVASIFYHSSNGGATEDSENIFSEALPWLRGVIDVYEPLIKTGKESWSETFTAGELTAILQSKGYPVSDIVSVTPTYTKLGNVYSLKFTDNRGKNFTFEREAARSILNSKQYNKAIYSQRYTIYSQNQAPAPTPVPGFGEISVIGADEPGGDVYAVGSDGSVQKVDTGGVTVITSSGALQAGASGAAAIERNLVSGEVQSGSSYIVNGSGWGHNAGLSQFGAKAMAEIGMLYSDILHYYFTNIEITALQ